MENDSLGDRMKSFEATTTSQRLMQQLPWLVRLDGKGFHKFTKGLERPFSLPLRELMLETTVELVKMTNANVGYTQSDEITICWNNKDYKNEGFFAGKIYKINSIMASLCTLTFNRLLPKYLDKKYADQCPLFDCRVFYVPNDMEAYNVFLWRELDATRNSIQMAGSSVFSHSSLQNKNCDQIQEMLFSERNINWNNYPDWCKRGTFVRRKKEMVKFEGKELDKLPLNHKARSNPDLLVKRSVLKIGSSPILTKLENPVDWLFGE